MSCKDIKDEPILRYLEQTRERGLATWSPPPDNGNMPTVASAMPLGTPKRLILAKMKSLIAKGLVDGCACGCRGDFELTRKARFGLAMYDDIHEHTQKHGKWREEK